MMQPGRELDTLIAEKVMGWVVDGDGEIFREAVYLMDLNQWRPSELVSYAWWIVNEMMSRGYDFELKSASKTYLFEFQKGGRHFCSEWENSLPIAICDAALQTLEKREKKAA